MINDIFQIFFKNNLDQKISIWFINQRSDFGISFFEFISSLGDWRFLLLIFLIVILVLYFFRKKKYIIPYILVVGSAEILTFLGKLYFHRSRPGEAVFLEQGLSFPSGHATIAVSFYGYLAFILIKSSPRKYRKLIIILTSLLAGLIGLSRLYLGVHYLSDVLAGYMVGSLSLFLGIKITKRYFLKKRKK